MSEGTIFNLLNKAANAVLPIYEGIKQEIEKATTVGGDESGVKVKNQNYWAWTWQTILATYIVITKSRGFVTVNKTFPDGFPNATYVSDSLSAQLKTLAKQHQLCLAHLLRELNYFEQISVFCDCSTCKKEDRYAKITSPFLFKMKNALRQKTDR